MGRIRTSSRRTSKNKAYKKAHDTKNRRKDIDQIQDEIKKQEVIGTTIELEPDEDLPGLGQFFCMHCARHFTNDNALSNHLKSKDHRRRLKDLAQPQYTQAEAERAAGMTKEVLPPAHPRSDAAMV